MVVGIELALAIVPLVISAAEHHEAAIQKGKILISNKAKTDRQLDFFYEIHDELALLHSTLKGLIREVPSHADSTRLWLLTSNDLRQIDDTLGDNAEPFQDILRRLLKSLDDLVSDRSLGLEKTDLQSSKVLYKKLERFKVQIDVEQIQGSLLARFQFTRNEKSRAIALQRIQEANKKLERLLRNPTLPASNPLRCPTTKKPHSTRLRRLSEPLFNKIAKKWPKACECHSRHEARLCLWNCCSSQRDPESRDSLDMLVSVSDVKSDGAPWQESTIQVVERSDPINRNPTVHWRGEQTPTSESRVPGRDIDSESFCRLIHQAHGQQSTLQIIYDHEKLWQIQSRKGSLSRQKQKDKTLKDLLTDPSPHITLKEQRILAVTLAHAALHCSDGPWLGEDWSKEHITFFSNDSSTEPDMSRPFLKVRFEDDHQNADPTCGLFNLHSNPALLSLGILLLEIYLKEPIEAMWTDDDLIEGQPNENTKLTTALRCLQDAEGEVYEGYREAIQACLEYDTQDVGKGDLRHKVYTEIVWPLEQELYHGFKIKPEDLQLAPLGLPN